MLDERVRAAVAAAVLLLPMSVARADDGVAMSPSQAAASEGKAYRDDRSTPEALITSLYNAVNRKEYLRAWSYFSDTDDRPAFENFAKGYETTASVRLLLGETDSEGAAGSIYTQVPVAIEATADDGSVAVFTGCYLTRLVQPADQATPPFRPLQIEKAKLARSQQAFADADPSCAGVFP
ncbi:hypothetical protein [Mangrovibrevibacter kandeliae]|uniref:hypothetical protein n=1 Tax=Mangrovibrevibacter kandeliae TaxID=2968473 RepID=UPI002117C2C4|nr:hypothetical protein [Aurantimonas sp. CSK15Z-1]MCQ8782414.1 hypothetical protein [Aurantimonas sp. CSK15Z-1]